jgi:hypothetical protein
MNKWTPVVGATRALLDVVDDTRARGTSQELEVIRMKVVELLDLVSHRANRGDENVS